MDLQEDAIGRTAGAHLAEHRVRDDDLGHSGAEQVELTRLGEQDQG